MATSVTQSLFGMTPQMIQAQREADLQAQALRFAQLTPMQQAQAGLFTAGSQLGTGIAGALGYEDPEMAQARARQGLLGGVDMSDPQALREAARNTTDPQVKVFLTDRANALEKEQADINRLNALAAGGGRTGGSAGTGPERMLKHIADVDTRVAQGQQVSQADINLANNYREYFARRKTYQMPDGSILTLDVNDFSGQRQAEAEGGIVAPPSTGGSAPQGTPAPVAQGTPRGGAGGARVTETPASRAAAEAKAEGERQSQVIGASDINQIDKAINILDESGRFAAGLGSVLRFIPETSAGELDALISSIDAGKLINQIQALKATSSTGATGFGSLTEKEGQRLIDRLGSLRQGAKPETLRANLVEIRDLMQKLQSGTTAPAQPTPQPRQGGTQGNNEAIINRVMNDPRNAGKTRAQVEAALRKRGLIK